MNNQWSDLGVAVKNDLFFFLLVPIFKQIMENGVERNPEGTPIMLNQRVRQSDEAWDHHGPPNRAAACSVAPQDNLLTRVSLN